MLARLLWCNSIYFLHTHKPPNNLENLFIIICTIQWLVGISIHYEILMKKSFNYSFHNIFHEDFFFIGIVWNKTDVFQKDVENWIFHSASGIRNNSTITRSFIRGKQQSTQVLEWFQNERLKTGTLDMMLNV